MAVGKGVSIEYIKETSYGSPPAAASRAMLWLGDVVRQPKIRIDPGLIKSKYSGLVQYKYLQTTRKDVGFDIDFIPQDVEMIKAAILKAGAATTRAVNEVLDSFAFDIGINGVYFWFTGCKINTIKVSGKVGDEVKISMNVTAKDVSVSTSAVDVTGGGSHASASSTLPVIFSGALIQRGGTPADLFASDFNLNINNNLKGVQKFNTSGTLTIDSLLEGDLISDGDTTVYFENKTLWDEIVAQTKSQILIKIKYGSTTATITLANAQLEKGDVVAEDNDAAVYKLLFTHEGITIATA